MTKQFAPGDTAFRHPCTLTEPDCRVVIVEELATAPPVDAMLNSGAKVKVTPFPHFKVRDTDGNHWIVPKIRLSTLPVTRYASGNHKIQAGWQP